MYNIFFIIILLILIIIIKLSFTNNLERFYTKYAINEIKPKYIFNSQSKIAFVYFYTENIYNYCKHSLANIIAYCEKYNYGFIVYNEIFNDDVAMCWNKIASIILNLSNYDYLIWIDADAIINNFDISIESIINLDKDKDLFICEDIIKDKECVNSGVMIIKNSIWSHNLFNKVWNSNYPHLHNDQNVIFVEIVKEIYPNEEPDLKYSKFCYRNIHPKVYICSQNVFNTHIYDFKPNDFILHLMGDSAETRIHVMRQINKKLNLDFYDNDDCVKYLDGSHNSNLDYHIQIIKNKCLRND